VELKDIVKRNNIRDVDLLERIIAYLTCNAGTAFTAVAVGLLALLVLGKFCENFYKIRNVLRGGK